MLFNVLDGMHAKDKTFYLQPTTIWQLQCQIQKIGWTDLVEFEQNLM